MSPHHGPHERHVPPIAAYRTDPEALCKLSHSGMAIVLKMWLCQALMIVVCGLCVCFAIRATTCSRLLVRGCITATVYRHRWPSRGLVLL